MQPVVISGGVDGIHLGILKNSLLLPPLTSQKPLISALNPCDHLSQTGSGETETQHGPTEQNRIVFQPD